MIYSFVETAKDGNQVPIFQSGKPMHSKYNPLKEAETQCNQIEFKDLFIILGLGSGYLLKELKKRFPKSTFIVYENSADDISFLFDHIDGLKDFISKNSIPCFSSDQISQTLPYYFKPAIYPTLEIIDNRNWLSEIKDQAYKIKESFNKAIDSISRDYSVQCHFGKFFQHNILKNCHFLKQDQKNHLDLSKIAVITAAGPSLDSKIPWIRENRDNIILISTDTASKSLSKQNINWDYTVSIDGQLVSQAHFIGENLKGKKLILDLCANSSIFRKALKSGANVTPSNNGHPLVSYLSFKMQNKDFSINLCSGSGTVTIACCDFALKAGFSKIIVIGADFGYKNRKPYCKGTYLDRIYNSQSTRVYTSEQQYSHLMFRSDWLEHENNKETTKLLKSYEKSFIQWTIQNNLEMESKDDFYVLRAKTKRNTIIQTSALQFFNEQLFNEKDQISKSDELINAMLPFMAYLRNKNQKQANTDELFNIALKELVRYTK